MAGCRTSAPAHATATVAEQVRRAIAPLPTAPPERCGEAFRPRDGIETRGGLTQSPPAATGLTDTARPLTAPRRVAPGGRFPIRPCRRQPGPLFARRLALGVGGGGRLDRGNPVTRRRHRRGAGPAVRLWDVAERREIGRGEAHRDPVSALAFSPDGSRLASASEDATALIWDVTAIVRRGRTRPDTRDRSTGPPTPPRPRMPRRRSGRPNDRSPAKDGVQMRDFWESHRNRRRLPL